MRCKLILTVFLLFIGVFCFAQQAVILEITGTVEIKHSSSSVWEPALEGQALTEDTSISTGFRSAALLRIGSSVITVRPLTRLTLSEIAAEAGVEVINVNLQAGRVRVDVKPPAGSRASMTVQSPASVSSVRGTVFEFDTLNLVVLEGTMEFSGVEFAIPVLVDAGRYSYIDDRTGRAVSPEITSMLELKPGLPIGSQIVIPLEQTVSTLNTEYTEELGTGIYF